MLTQLRREKMETIAKRANKLKAEAVTQNVFDLDLRKQRELLNRLAKKHAFEAAVITNSAQQNISLATKRGTITV
jgi:hypothetical protein